MLGGDDTYFRVEQVPHGGVVTHGKTLDESLSELSGWKPRVGRNIAFESALNFLPMVPFSLS